MNAKTLVKNFKWSEHSTGLGFILLFLLGCFTGAMLSGFWGIRAIWAGVPVLVILAAAHHRICKIDTGDSL